MREFLFPTGGGKPFSQALKSDVKYYDFGGEGAGGGERGQMPARVEDDMVARTFFVHGMEVVLYTEQARLYKI